MRHLFNNPRQLVIISIVLRLDPVAGPVGSIFFLKSKQHRFSKKKQKSMGLQPGRRVTPGFFFPRFFFNPAGFQPWVLGRPVGLDRVSKL
jgi:hypothetical protein